MAREPHRVIKLSKGFVVVIDAEDFRKVNRHKWYAHVSAGKNKKYGRPYARANIKGKNIYLHRFLMDPPEDMQVDHINHCTLDCRRSNMRNVTNYENQKNRRNRRKRDV